MGIVKALIGRSGDPHSFFYHQLRGGVLLMVVVLAIIGGVVHYFSQQQLAHSVQNSLQSQAEFRKDRIQALFERQKRWMEKVASGAGFVGFSEQLIDYYRAGGVESASYQQLLHRFRGEHQELFTAQGVRDLFLLNAGGELVFSLRPMEEELGVNLSASGFYGETIFSGLIEGITHRGALSLSRYGSSEQLESSTVLMGAPLFSLIPGQEEKMIGILVRPLQLDELRYLLETYAGLGETGEITVAQWRGEGEGSGVNFITHFRGEEARQPDQACQQMRRDQPERFPVLHALQGDSGSGWMIDNVCTPVYAIWFHIPELDWGIVLKQDREEVLAPMRRLNHQVLFAILLSLPLLLWLLQRQAKILSRPIEQLTEAAGEDSIEALQFGRVHEVNHLVDSLKQLIKVLREQDNVESIFSAMQEGMMVVNEAGRIVRCNHKLAELLGRDSDETLRDSHIGQFVVDHSGASVEPRLLMMRERLLYLYGQNRNLFQQSIMQAPIPLVLVGLDLSDGVRLELLNDEAGRLFEAPGEKLLHHPLQELVAPKSWPQILEMLRESSQGERCIQDLEISMSSKSGGEMVTSVCMMLLSDHEMEQVLILFKSEGMVDETLLHLTPFGRLFRAQGAVGQEGTISMERELRCCDGALIPVQLSGSMLKMGERSGAVITVHDLRERKALERAAQEAAYQGGQAEISAQVLHNFGNSLVALKFYLGELDQMQQLLRNIGKIMREECEQPVRLQLVEALEEAEKEWLGDELRSIQGKVKRMGELVTAQQGMVGDGGGYWVSRFELKKALEEALLLVRDRAERSGIALNVEVGVARRVVLPKSPLQQMVIALLRNAIESIERKNQQQSARSAAGTVELVVSAVDEQAWQLRCCDNGVGIPSQQLVQLFVPTVSGTDEKGNSLHTAANFVHSNGGEISCSSEGEGKGACFEVRLPFEADGA